MDKAKESYVRLLTDSHKLFGKIYRDGMDPISLQAHLTPFLKDRGPEFSRQLTGLSFEYFKGLSELQARYTEDFMRDLLGDAMAPPPSLPSADPQDWTQWSQTLSAYVTEQAQRAQSRYQQLLEKVARGEITPATIQDFSAKFAADRAPFLARDSAELNSRFLEGLIRLNQRFVDTVFDHLMGNGAGHPDAPMESVRLDLAGPSGSAVSAALVVENTGAEASEVHCKISEFRDTEGKEPAFRAPLQVDPTDFRLRPGEARSINLRLAMTPEVFALGRNYEGTLLIHQEGQSVVVTLTARATAGPPDEEAPPSVLRLGAPIGGIASASLTLANTREEQALIRCNVTEIRRADGVGPAFAPKIMSRQEVFDLAPGEEASMQLSLRLDEADYDAEALYVGALLITGLGKSRLEVPLRIIASQAAPPGESTIRISPQ